VSRVAKKKPVKAAKEKATRAKAMPLGTAATKVETVLVLRACMPNMTSYDGFEWPKSGHVAAKDWSPIATCGRGLHGWAWGEGDIESCNSRIDINDPKTPWLVVEVKASDIVDLKGKVKFPAGNVVFCGDRVGATEFIAKNGGHGRAIIFGTSTSGYGGTSTSGDGGTSTSGYGGTSTSGYGGTSTSGDGGTSTSGARGTSTSGDGGTSTSGYGGTSTSGDGGTSTSGGGGTSTSGYGGTSTSGARGTSTSGARGTSTSGDGGTSTSGDGGTSTSGYGGTSTSGARGTSTSGYGGTSTSGAKGIIVIRWYDAKAERYRLKVGYPGEDGIEEGKLYILDANQNFVLKPS
jgi:hypothetical protein